MSIHKICRHPTPLVCLALLCASAAQSGQPAQRPSGPRLCLVDRAGLTDRVRHLLQAEIETGLEALDVRVRVQGPEAEGEVTPCQAATVTVQLWPMDGVFLGASPEAMGAVRIHRERGVESAHVFLTVVIRTLTGSRGVIEEPTALELGRALGRVAAHETIHALAPELPHRRHGLMHHAMSRDFLLRPRPALLEGSALRTVIRSLEHRPLERRAGEDVEEGEVEPDRLRGTDGATGSRSRRSPDRD